MHLGLQILAIALAAVTLPLVLEILLVTLGLCFWRRKAVKRRQAEEWDGLLYIVIPAHNEGLLIQRTLASVMAAADADTRVLVVAHNCEDATAELARESGVEVVELREGSGRGKGVALQNGFAYALQAGARAVCVVDADSTVSGSFVQAMRRALKKAPAVQCRSELESGPGHSAAANLQALAFRAFNDIRGRGRAVWNLSCGLFGNGFALRAELLRSVPYAAFSIAEDLEYHIALVRQGVKVEYTTEGKVFGQGAAGAAAAAQRSRWEGGRLRVARENAASLLLQVLQGNLRLAEPLLDLLSLPLALGVALLAASLLVPVMPLRLYAAAALLLLASHVFAAVLASPAPGKALNILLRVPFYIVWKVALMPRVLHKSRRNAAWERSARATHVQAQGKL